MRTLGFGVLLFTLASSVFADAWHPLGASHGEIVQHLAYTLNYNDHHEVANWVAYPLGPDQLRDCVSRGNNFRPDPDLHAGSATLADYAQSGYDRGHLAPAGDMKWSAKAMSESFYLDNITPQTGRMNRGKWAALENLVRAWAKASDETLIVTGPVLEANLSQIGPSRVSVPRLHFKALLINKRGVRKAIGFLMDQEPSGDLSTFAVSIRKLEQLTGLDFFPHLTRKEQDRLETSLDFSSWDFHAAFAYAPCSGNANSSTKRVWAEVSSK